VMANWPHLSSLNPLKVKRMIRKTGAIFLFNG
jgi:hypothetical protein